MKTLVRFSLCCSFFLLLFACSENHFIKDEAIREQVEMDFATKKKLMPDGDLFSIFQNPELTTFEREALTFLYAYMPIGDITDYSGEYYLENIRLSGQACNEMSWGKTIPDDVFRHFVLPLRVNNENLDDARKVFYMELKDRVRHLSMQDAILEVNHWCHEKVVYRPSDARTSSPLASVKTAFGRCGEESTFTVAALRAVGIPARQVYTPRWAHTDDNHAWVEAWADGRWFFFGACEPEPVLNLGWFNAPASRGMLMHTKVFGRYRGVEEKMYETPNYTEINVIANYAPTAKGDVLVFDGSGRPVADARVEFKVYNYAEFYTVATKYTDTSGKTSLTAGKGDMLVWASNGDMFGYEKITFGKDGKITVVLNKKPGETYSLPLDIVPPAEGGNVPEVTPEQRKENEIRLVKEDSIRNAYVATMMTEGRANDYIRQHWADSGQVTANDTRKSIPNLLVASRGNYQTLIDFISGAVKAQKSGLAIELLNKISEKDLRDVTLQVLEDHLMYSERTVTPQADYLEYILNPRIANEMLIPYKQYFQQVIPAGDAEVYRKNPELLIAWCKQNIAVRNELNSQHIPVSPVGVWKSRVADTRSRDIFFVALSRSLGIPAWIDPVTGKVQYCDFNDSRRKEGKTFDVDFETEEQGAGASGVFQATYKPVPSLDDPKYYSHFTLSRFSNGTFHLLNYDEDGVSWKNLLQSGVRLDAGYYMLTTGTRLANGSVLANVSFFNVERDKQTVTALEMRQSRDQVQVIGSFNSESVYLPVGVDVPSSILQTSGRGYFIVGILGMGQEPTNHALKDIAALGQDFEKWGRKMILLFPEKEQFERFNPSEFPGLPSTISWGTDIDGTIRQQIVDSMKLKSKSSLPVFIIADTFNRVVFVSQGYTIGLGEQLMKVIHGL